MKKANTVISEVQQRQNSRVTPQVKALIAHVPTQVSESPLLPISSTPGDLTGHFQYTSHQNLTFFFNLLGVPSLNNAAAANMGLPLPGGFSVYEQPLPSEVSGKNLQFVSIYCMFPKVLFWVRL